MFIEDIYQGYKCSIFCRLFVTFLVQQHTTRWHERMRQHEHETD